MNYYQKSFKISITIIFLVTFFMLFSSSIKANNVDLKIEKYTGHTSYIIQGDNINGEWKSLLEFPLNTVIISGKYTYKVEKNNYVDNLSFSYKTNIIDDSGTFKDSDWVYGSDEKMIYAETDSELNSNEFDISIETFDYKINNWFNYSFIGGYNQQNFNFVAGDGWQESYLTNPPERYEIEGDAIEYEVNYKIPYVGLKIFKKQNDFKFSNDLILAPIIFVSDYDYHILRDKTAETKARGYAFFYKANIKYNINDNFEIKGNLGFEKIYSEGYQKQTFSDGSIAENIDTKVFSKKYYLGLSMIYKF